MQNAGAAASLYWSGCWRLVFISFIAGAHFSVNGTVLLFARGWAAGSAASTAPWRSTPCSTVPHRKARLGKTRVLHSSWRHWLHLHPLSHVSCDFSNSQCSSRGSLSCLHWTAPTVKSRGIICMIYSSTLEINNLPCYLCLAFAMCHKCRVRVHYRFLSGTLLLYEAGYTLCSFWRKKENLEKKKREEKGILFFFSFRNFSNM